MLEQLFVHLFLLRNLGNNNSLYIEHFSLSNPFTHISAIKANNRIYWLSMTIALSDYQANSSATTVFCKLFPSFSV